jgi:HK97 family phage major capsid protein
MEQRQIELLNKPEIRSMTIATNQAGGFLVPAYWEATLIEKLASANVMRQLADVLPLQSGDRKLPIVTDKGSAAWIGEGKPYPESDIALDNILLGGYKLARIIQISEELMNDSVVNIDSMIIDAFVQSFAEMEEAAFINGWTGTQDRPTGILGRASLGVTGSKPTEITTDEVFDLFYSLKRPYRAKASWLMNDQSIKIIRKLKTSDGQYIWSPGFGTEPPTLLGRPVYTSESMPVMAAGKTSILFGDFSYYKIADRQGRVMQRLNEKYADVGNVGFRMFQRVDGNLALPEAVKSFKNA